MEQVATCKSCGSQSWIIYQDRCKCTKCNKEYKWQLDVPSKQSTRAQDIINLVNDNH